MTDKATRIAVSGRHESALSRFIAGEALPMADLALLESKWLISPAKVPGGTFRASDVEWALTGIGELVARGLPVDAKATFATGAAVNLRFEAAA